MGTTNREAGKGANRDGGQGDTARRGNDSHSRFERQGLNKPASGASRSGLDRTGGRHVPNSGSPSPGKPCSK